MRILAINNYDLEWAYKEFEEVPMHQTWGVLYKRKKVMMLKTVGDNVRIGAGAIVVTDVPSNTTIESEKSRIILHY